MNSQLNPVHPRHLDIHKDNVRRRTGYLNQNGFSAVALPHDFHVRLFRQHAAKSVTNHLMVVYQENSNIFLPSLLH